MSIYFSQLDEEHAWRFRSPHWVHTEASDDKHLVTLTGIVIIDFKGTGTGWLRDKLDLALKFPPIIPGGMRFQVEHWAPFVTINAIANDQHAVNAGWAVDEFGGPGPVKILNAIGLWANLAVRDVDGYCYRLGYSLTVSGVFTERSPGPG